jgi:hypothetical protein
MFTSQQKLDTEAFKKLAVRRERNESTTYFFEDGSFVEVTKYAIYRYLPNGQRIN